jgi:hypothetical protein
MGLRTRAFRTFRTLAGTVLVVLVLLLLGASRVVAQAPARTVPITGTVIDPSGAGAAGVMVSLKQGAGAVLLSTQTIPPAGFALMPLPKAAISSSRNARVLRLR